MISDSKSGLNYRNVEGPTPLRLRKRAAVKLLKEHFIEATPEREPEQQEQNAHRLAEEK